MGIYGNKLVNMIATKPLCASWSNLVDMLAMVRWWDPIDFGGQKSKVKVSMDIYGHKTVNTSETKPFKGEGHDGYHWQMWGAQGCYALRCYIFYWNDEAPNTVSILTFIKCVGNLDGVKLHWVGRINFFQWLWTRYVYFYISLWKIMPPGSTNLPPKSIFWLHINLC